jgi:hypothetical protein
MPAMNLSILTIGLVANAAITQNAAVTATGSIAVAGSNAIGFANTSAAIGERVPVTAIGTALAIAGMAIDQGDAVEVGELGAVITQSTGIAIGRALSSATIGATLEVLIINN